MKTIKPLIVQRADPFLTLHNGIYYFTASVPQYDCIELRSAKSIAELRTSQPKIVWRKHESGIMSEHIWAPEMHLINGRWYIYFAASDKDNKWELRPYVLECCGDNPMEHDWKELGAMQGADGDNYSFTDFSLDGTVFQHRGECYFIWAEKVGQRFGISNLYIAKMQSPTKLETVQVLLSTPDYDWERIGFWVNEAPAVYKKNGKIFLTYSASATGASYCMGMLSASEDADLLDPRSWQKRRYPVLATSREVGLYGTGHNSFCVDESGADISIFHAREYEEIVGDPLYDYNRNTYIMRVDVVDDELVFDFKRLCKYE